MGDGTGRLCSAHHRMQLQFKLPVRNKCHPYLLDIEGLFTQGWRPGRTLGESVGGISEIDSSDWSSGIRYHAFVTRPDTEFNTVFEGDTCVSMPWQGICWCTPPCHVTRRTAGGGGVEVLRVEATRHPHLTPPPELRSYVSGPTARRQHATTRPRRTRRRAC